MDSGCASLCQPSYTEKSPPREKSTSATMNDQKNTALPQPRGYSGLGSRFACFMPQRSRPWLPLSAYEWIASASIELEPVAIAAPVLATAMARFAPSAYRIVRTESAFATGLYYFNETERGTNRAVRSGWLPLFPESLHTAGNQGADRRSAVALRAAPARERA